LTALRDNYGVDMSKKLTNNKNIIIIIITTTTYFACANSTDTGANYRTIKNKLKKNNIHIRTE
jgi:hypothetical protein